jgi:hypothetical protein
MPTCVAYRERSSAQFGFSAPSSVASEINANLSARVAGLTGLLPRLRIVDDAFALSPVPKGKISAYHPAKMRKMCDTLVSSENSAK